MVRSYQILVVVVSAALLAGCSNIGNMFGKTGPARLSDEAVVPEVKDSLKNLPKGLVADTEDVRHTGQTLIPQ